MTEYETLRKDIARYLADGWQIDETDRRNDEYKIISPKGSVYDSHKLRFHKCSFCELDAEYCNHGEELLNEERTARQFLEKIIALAWKPRPK